MTAEHRKVLVLNKAWVPVAIVTLQRAITLLFSQYRSGEPKARVIDPTQDFATFTWEDWSKMKPKAEEAFLQGVNVVFRIPEVILLSKYDKMPQQRVHFSRRTIYRRDGNQCMYCGKKPGTENLNLDHVVPRSRGGKTDWTNIVLACLDCNARKGNRLMHEIGYKFFIPGYKPAKPKFSLFKCDYKVESWTHFISSAYWSVELENDMKVKTK